MDNAQLLQAALNKILPPGSVAPVETNAVFTKLPKRIQTALKAEYSHFTWPSNPNDGPETYTARWVTSAQTTPRDIEGLCQAIQKQLAI